MHPQLVLLNVSQENGLKTYLGDSMIHAESVHEGKKPSQCSICDLKFAQETDLGMHIELFHTF